MATEPIIKVWCDICLGENGDRLEAETSYMITIEPEQRRKQLDLCAEHRVTVDTLASILRQYGTMPTDTLPKAGERRRQGIFTCPRCRAEVPSRGAASTHARQHHGLPLSVLEFELGLGPEPQNLVKCPDCGAGVFEGFQGYSAHRLRKHGEARNRVDMTQAVPTGMNGGRPAHKSDHPAVRLQESQLDT